MKTESVTVYDKTTCHHCHRHLSWSGVFAGAFVAIGLTFLFNLLTTGLGLSLYSKNEQGMAALTVVGLIWLVLGVFFVFFFSGWSAGKVAARTLACGHPHRCSGGMLHGFLAWTLYLILSLLILSHIGEATSVRLFKNTFTSIGSGSEVDITTGNSTAATPAPSPKASNRTAAEESKGIAEGNLETKDINKLGWVALTTFILFALGALGACIGACCGISHCRKKYEEEYGNEPGYPTNRPR